MPRYTSCIVPDNLAGNRDGYIRVRVGPSSSNRKQMLHRIEWEKVNGPIPGGHEINHLCKNRACANVNHLEVLTTSEHRSKDGVHKNKEVIAAVWIAHCRNPKKPQVRLAEEFNISPAAVCKIIKRNKFYG